MACCLFKSAPGAFSCGDQVRDKLAERDGVRNHRADNNMKSMKLGDRSFSRRSVAPIRGPEWEIPCAMAGTGA